MTVLMQTQSNNPSFSSLKLVTHHSIGTLLGKVIILLIGKRSKTTMLLRLDLLMSIIKFYIWSRFASYMFGDSPNINIMSSHIFKRSFQTLKLIARRHPKSTSIETSHSNIRCPAGWELVLEQFVE